VVKHITEKKPKLNLVNQIKFVYLHHINQTKETMRVDHTKFALFNYESVKCKNPFKLGDVVIKPKDYEGDECNEIGVVIQIHDENELRTDMFGNEDISMLKKATKKEIKNFRKDLLVTK
jgi:hypothetical protein